MIRCYPRTRIVFGQITDVRTAKNELSSRLHVTGRRGRPEVNPSRRLPVRKVVSADKLHAPEFENFNEVWRAIEQCVRAPAIQGLLFDEYRRVNEFPAATLQWANCDMQLILDEPELKLNRGGRVKMQMNVGSFFLEPGDDLSEPELLIANGRVRDSYVQVSHQSAAKGANLAAELFKGFKKIQGGLVDPLAFDGKPESASSAIAESHSKAELKVRDLVADCWLSDIQLRPSRGETAAPSNCDEHPQQAQVQI